MSERLPSRSPSPPPPPPPPPAQPYEVLFTQSFDDISEQLPSADDIEDSTETIQDFSGRCTAYVGDSFVAKYGLDVEPIEAYNMRFVREHLDPDLVTIPRVVAIYQRPIAPSRQITYIIMERIPGVTLGAQWDGLDDSRKEAVSDQLRKVFHSLRNISHVRLHDSYFYGSIDKTGLRDNIFWTETPIPSINGPFPSMDSLIEGMIARYIRDGGPRLQYKADYYRRVFPRVLQGNGVPVFTHGDFQRKNIICCPDGRVALLDWASSGWYPSYWEYATAIFACGSWEDD